MKGEEQTHLNWSSERVRGNESLVKVAVVQFEPRLGEKDRNLKRIGEFVGTAADEGAGLVVLPELCSTGYVFNSQAELAAVAEPVPDGETVRALERLASPRGRGRHGLYIVAGLAEVDGHSYYNSAVLVGPKGYVGTYRKAHLWYEEKLFFEPGDTGFPVFQTPLGRIGLLVCYDIWFPEAVRHLVIQGADLIAVPTNWVVATNGQTWDERGYAMANYVVMAQSNMNQVFMACADRIGAERGAEFPGCSIVTGPSGWPLAGPAGRDTEEIIYADVNLVKSRWAKSYNDLSHALHDRRTDIYG